VTGIITNQNIWQLSFFPSVYQIPPSLFWPVDGHQSRACTMHSKKIKTIKIACWFFRRFYTVKYWYKIRVKKESILSPKPNRAHRSAHLSWSVALLFPLFPFFPLSAPFLRCQIANLSAVRHIHDDMKRKTQNGVSALITSFSWSLIVHRWKMRQVSRNSRMNKKKRDRGIKTLVWPLNKIVRSAMTTASVYLMALNALRRQENQKGNGINSVGILFSSSTCLCWF
jgi:hypothetical protein